MEEHYICVGGCKGESDRPMTCHAKDCRDYGKPMVKCDCPDKKHNGSFEEPQKAPEKKEEEQK